MATNARHLETAEVAYSAIHEADKVHYIQYIKVSSEMLRSRNYAPREDCVHFASVWVNNCEYYMNEPLGTALEGGEERRDGSSYGTLPRRREHLASGWTHFQVK